MIIWSRIGPYHYRPHKNPSVWTGCLGNRKDGRAHGSCGLGDTGHVVWSHSASLSHLAQIQYSPYQKIETSDSHKLKFYGILSDMSSDLLSGILSDISSEILCGRGPAEHSDPELAVRVRRGILRSQACSWGPGNTAIISLQLRSGGEHSGILWSWACCSGPAGNTAIRSLQLRSGGGGGGERGRQLTWNLTTLTRQVGKKFVYMRACETLTGLNVWNQMLTARMIGVTWRKDSTSRWNLTCACIPIWCSPHSNYKSWCN